MCDSSSLWTLLLLGIQLLAVPFFHKRPRLPIVDPIRLAFLVVAAIDLPKGVDTSFSLRRHFGPKACLSRLLTRLSESAQGLVLGEFGLALFVSALIAISRRR